MEDLVTYVCQSSERKVTKKVALNGYAYTKRGGKGEVCYWYCDQRKICSASLIEKGGVFSSKVDKFDGKPLSSRGWGLDGRHEAHAPDYERINKEISTRKRRLEKRKRAREKRAAEEHNSSAENHIPSTVSTINKVNCDQIECDNDKLEIEIVRGPLSLHEAVSNRTVSNDSPSKNAQVTPVLIDTDGGFYDAWALALALGSAPKTTEKEFKVVGITTVNGCTTVENAVQNVGRVLRTIGGAVRNIPVYKGTDSSLLRSKESTPRPPFFGSDGFGDILSPVSPDEELKVGADHGVNRIIRLAEKYKGNLTILALGPLTNLAMAVKLQPEIKNYVKEIYVVGGNSEGVGNVTVCGEFNFYADPEAAHVVLENFNACPMYLLPWETCMRSAASSYTFRTRTLGALRSPLVSLLNKIESKNLRNHSDCWVAPDAVAVACFMNNKVMRKTEPYHCSVELQGKHTRGMMVVDKNFVNQKPANVILITEIDRQGFEKMLAEAVGGDHSHHLRTQHVDSALNLDQNYF